MAKRLVLFGASNPCVLRVIEAINRSSPEWELMGFVDDTPGKAGRDFFGFPILGPREVIPQLGLENIWFFNNVFGSTAARRTAAGVLESHGCTLTSLIWPNIDRTYCRVGTDVVCEENVSLDAGAVIGDHAAVKRNASVGHETIAGDFVFIGPGATVCGRVTIEAGAYIGAGSVIRDGLVIGQDSVVGIGAVVVKNVPPGATVVGNPARPLGR